MWHANSEHNDARRPRGQREGGAAAILVAITMFVLLGFAGLVLDLGHLYVNKTELQNAADACALAAANELVCDDSTGACNAAFLQNAEAAGIFVASRNMTDFQGSAVAITADDIRFSKQLAGPYLTRAEGANTGSKFAKCNTARTGIAPWFMQMLGNATANSVGAAAVATLAPGQTACNSSPIGVCAKDLTGEPYGYTVGEWITSNFNNGAGGNASLDGNFRWVDFTPNAGGTNEVRDQLLGTSTVCGIAVGDEVREEGVKQGAKHAYNTRFGIYQNGASAPGPETAPPDKTGFAYPSSIPAIPVGTSAYADYKAKQATGEPFADRPIYAVEGPGGNVNGDQLTNAEHLMYGSERRVVSVPVVECGKSPASVTILGMACVLMLNPMSNGASGNIYIEWRGMADTASSPCRSAGVAGGVDGPLVPTLVQ
jgi:Flp pilus assembly protein TadG